MELELGTIIDGRYFLESLIGEGGSATVWRAVQMDLDRPVAIKFLRLRDAREPSALRLLAEAKTSASIRHRNVVDTIDVGQVDTGAPYMVMELLEGESLFERSGREPTLSASEIIQIARGALGGLGAVHDARVIHRDLKPENIFLVRDADGVFPKLLDFGISEKHAEEERGLPVQQRRLAGTPFYMAPEQCAGASAIDARSDVYAMGVILFELLTGELPFESEDLLELFDRIRAGCRVEPVDIAADVDPELNAIVVRAMKRDPSERFQSAREMRNALLAVNPTRSALQSRRPPALRSRRTMEQTRTLSGAPTAPANRPSSRTLTEPPIVESLVPRSQTAKPGGDAPVATLADGSDLEATALSFASGRWKGAAAAVAAAVVVLLAVGAGVGFGAGGESPEEALTEVGAPPAPTEAAREEAEPREEPPRQVAPSEASELSGGAEIAERDAEARETPAVAVDEVQRPVRRQPSWRAQPMRESAMRARRVRPGAVRRVITQADF